MASRPSLAAADSGATVTVCLPVIGWCRLEATERGLRRVEFVAERPRKADGGGGGAAERWLRQAAAELQEYAGGQRREFTVPLDPAGLSAFQRAVLEACGRIPWGATATYGELARQVGVDGGARAVGQVMARNPLPVVIPCHRVVGAGGALTGFGGGMALKRRLLALERSADSSRKPGLGAG